MTGVQTCALPICNTFEEIVRWIVHSKTGIEEELSFRFVYAVCKSLDGVSGQGTFPSLAAKVVRKYGVPLAKFCPNDVKLDHEDFVYQRKLSNIPKAAFEIGRASCRERV